MLHEKKTSDIFSDLEDFFNFIDECIGDVCFVVEEKKDNDQSNSGKLTDSEQKKSTSSEKKQQVSIFETIIRECSKLPEPYTAIYQEKSKIIKEIAERIKHCKDCELHKGRTNAVPGDGNPNTYVVFVGEAPGYDEDKRGKPFVGKSGKLLNKLIEDILGLKREDVFITNVVRCRPPQNRTPDKKEIETCSHYLFEELDVIKPRLVVALGAPAAKVLLDKDEKISELRGNFYTRSDFTVFVTFHPAFVIRNPAYMEVLQEDFKKIKEFLQAI
jgi:uracil-DNA glycosylase family 4